MSDVQLSPEQARAVEHAHGDAVVVAGAGSGKTRVLTSRFLHLVRRRGLPIHALAALTFTERAAREMRERIAEAFDAQGDDAAVAEVEMADIGTLHAWCAALLRRHAVAAGVDPGFVLLDPAEQGLLVGDAAAAAEARLQEDHAGRHAWRQLGAWLTASPRSLLLQLQSRLRGAAVRAADLTWAAGGGDARALAVDAQRALHDVRDALATVDPAPEVRGLAEMALGALAAALEEPTSAVRAFTLLNRLAEVPNQPISRKKIWSSSHKALVEVVKRLAAAELDEVGASTVLPSLQHVLQVYEDAYAEAKRERGLFDFDDLEHHALGYLDRLAAEHRSLEAAPRVVLVDEFQDTSPVQARLLERLRGQGAEQMVVGDAKQGIYRFRRADVRVLLAERERVGASGEHLLATSYRSAPDLVDAVNHVHARLFAEGAAGVPYEPLVAGATFAPPTPDVPPVELMFVREDDAPIADVTEQEAVAVAAWIRELVASQAPKRKAGKEGPIGYGDIAILLRARSRMADFERALVDAGVPHRTVGGRGWHQAQEIEDLRDALRVVHDPADDHAVAAFLAGPVVRASDEVLAACFVDADDPRSPWQRWCDAAQSPEARHVVDTVTRLRREAVLGSLAATVAGVLDDLGLLPATLAGPDGARRAANLRKALPLASALEEAGRRGLGDLLRQLERLDEEGADEAEAPVGGSADDAVRLMTVHAAKGLEFPVVILADVGRTGRSGTPLVRFEPGRGVATKVRDPLEGTTHDSAGYAALGEADKLGDDQELLRLLYVAATRAEERLVVTGSLTGQTKAGEPGGMYGWGRLLLGLLGVSPSCGTTDVPCDGETHTFVRVTIRDTAEVVAAPPLPPAPDAGEASDEAAACIRLAQQDAAPLRDTRYVASVTELVAFAASPAAWYERYVLGVASDPPRRTTSDEAEELRRPPREDDEVTWRVGPDPRAAAVGTAVHAYLERVAGLETALEQDRLDEVLADVFGRDVPPEAAKRVEHLVMRFLGSELGTRLGHALAEGADVRREMAFHVRVRFPERRRVGPFDGLLVRGTVDLWLPTERGVLLVDHKTAARSKRFPTPEAVAEHHAVQLRLYALAAERVEGADVAGAGVLLLDPSWGDEPVFAAVDVGGDALRETREVVEAFARAELEGRYPTRWRDLLTMGA
ncbi:MAG: UvrD-helicase domain-containing protein [Planctomycetota bacterium]